MVMQAHDRIHVANQIGQPVDILLGTQQKFLLLCFGKVSVVHHSVDVSFDDSYGGVQLMADVQFYLAFMISLFVFRMYFVAIQLEEITGYVAQFVFGELP